MSRIILVTGGMRSGKSSFAQGMAEKIEGPRTYIATCPVIDGEMNDRIKRHKEDREGKGWRTIEETVELGHAIKNATDGGVTLIECVTLWINNLMYRADKAGERLDSVKVVGAMEEILATCRSKNGLFIFVTNETGWGVVPDNATARLFCDVAGRVNQLIASVADEAWLVVSGINVDLKKEN